MYDRDTGLSRFGARDYDAETGWWTAKDPIGFEGGDMGMWSMIRLIGLIRLVRSSLYQCFGYTAANALADLALMGGTAMRLTMLIITAGLNKDDDIVPLQKSKAQPRPKPKPKNCPSGTKPIDQMGWSKDKTHET